jgi:hypothetical protein
VQLWWGHSSSVQVEESCRASLPAPDLPYVTDMQSCLMFLCLFSFTSNAQSRSDMSCHAPAWCHEVLKLLWQLEQTLQVLQHALGFVAVVDSGYMSACDTNFRSAQQFALRAVLNMLYMSATYGVTKLSASSPGQRRTTQQLSCWSPSTHWRKISYCPPMHISASPLLTQQTIPHCCSCNAASQHGTTVPCHCLQQQGILQHRPPLVQLCIVHTERTGHPRVPSPFCCTLGWCVRLHHGVT